MHQYQRSCGGRTGRIRGRGQGVSITPSSSSPSSSALPSLVAPLPTVVFPPIVAPASIGSPTDLPILSPSDSTAPLTSSSVAGSVGCDLPIINVDDRRLIHSHACSVSKGSTLMGILEECI
ncbi:uncharacterized protein LOC116000977 [Ipomoea triloba]|uniref:uncharacterized protein LOC116000977 n=1 Tax=Ipomoea triloba TaxID=35885 RepID=UPI00125D0375|nr:uncharacterized protein LOC116000977 [Ipomoea triloba]